MIKADDLYWSYFPLFYPEGFYGLLSSYLQDNVCVQARTLRGYYYCVHGRDFYLLDRALCNFYKLDLRLVDKVMKYGCVEGYVSLISREIMEEMDYQLCNDGYGKAFIYVNVVDAGIISACVYFVGEKQRIKAFLYAF